jgi:hypothetical protein
MTLNSTTTTQPSEPLYFKVLVNGRSFHKSYMAYSLPTMGDDGTIIPGEWHTVEGALKVCSWGLHVTSDPKEWWADGATAYVVEYGGFGGRRDDKICVRKLRLLREATRTELEAVQIFYAGTHEVTDGKAIAYGSSTVKSYGSSTVESYGSSTVKSYGSSTVKSYGSSTVKSYGSSTVESYGSSTVESYGSSTVKSYGSSTVVSTKWHGATAVVTTGESAVHIDRRG